MQLTIMLLSHELFYFIIFIRWHIKQSVTETCHYASYYQRRLYQHFWPQCVPPLMPVVRATVTPVVLLLLLAVATIVAW